MTRIIDETPDPGIAKRVSCDNCGVRLEYVPADTYKRTKHDYAGGSTDYTFLKCPKCEHEITLAAI